MSGNAVWFCAASAIFLASTAFAQIRFPLAGPNPVQAVKDAPDYLFLASLFPANGIDFEPDRQSVMAAQQLESGSRYLTTVFEVQKKVYLEQRPSIVLALSANGLQPASLASAKGTQVTFKDDQVAWSTTVSESEIVIGARMVRGLLLGSLRESSSGMAIFSQSFASYLGAASTGNLPAEDLEQRARLFFQATLKGKPQPRTDEEFDQHFRDEVALLDELRSSGVSAVHTELERRLRLAAQGGDISGADGMAIFDVFMRLQSHVDPALLFVLSHELRHVVLGHAPFPGDLTCPARQRREDDADLFAIALLVYDFPGEAEVEAGALARLGLGMDSGTGSDDLEYGYAHAIRYGFSLAGLTNMIGPACSYRDANDRIARLGSIRQTLVSARIAAFEQLYRYFRLHPPYIYTSQEVDHMRQERRQKYGAKLFARCHCGAAQKEVRFRKLDELPFGWVIACPNRFPASFSGAKFAERAGTETYRHFKAEYQRRIPVLLSDTTINALLGTM